MIKYLLLNSQGDLMTKNLATISFRANLLSRCKKYIVASQQNISRWNDLNNAVKPVNLDSLLQELLNSSWLASLVTIIETVLNDILVETIVAYPAKIGKKQITVQELNISASCLDTIIHIARKTTNDLAYLNFKKYLAEWQSYVGRLSAITDDQIDTFAEVKATRDIYIHNNGKPNDLYERKAGNKTRQTDDTGKLPIYESYVMAASQLSGTILDTILSTIELNFAHCIKEDIFREMWDATCCGKLVPFDKQWEVSTKAYYRKDYRWSWSSSEKALFDVFLRIFHGECSEITTDIQYALYRWPSDTAEGQIIRSWIEHPFYL